MQDDAIRAAQIHPPFISSRLKSLYGKFPAHLPRSCLENLKSQEPSQVVPSYEHIKFLKVFRGKVNLGQPSQLGSCEGALSCH